MIAMKQIERGIPVTARPYILLIQQTLTELGIIPEILQTPSEGMISWAFQIEGVPSMVSIYGEDGDLFFILTAKLCNVREAGREDQILRWAVSRNMDLVTLLKLAYRADNGELMLIGRGSCTTEASLAALLEELVLLANELRGELSSPTRD